MRGILVDWLIEVGEEYRLDGETVFLCIHYVDRYLSKLRDPLTRGKLQLLGVTALLIASYPLNGLNCFVYFDLTQHKENTKKFTYRQLMI